MNCALKGGYFFIHSFVPIVNDGANKLVNNLPKCSYLRLIFPLNMDFTVRREASFADKKSISAALNGADIFDINLNRGLSGRCAVSVQTRWIWGA